MPFTVDEFFTVFRLYNQAVWPVQIVLVGLGVAGVGLTVRGRPADQRWVSTILAGLWVWMGVAYHLIFFRAVNSAAWIFAVAFLLQGLLLAEHTWRPGSPATARIPRSRSARVIAIAIVVYALVGYPVIGWLLGHRYPDAPTFGVPCPTTIYTLGILAWWAPAVHWRLLVIPVAWAAVGTSAAVRLGVPEDWGLPAAAVLGVAAIALVRRRRRDPLVLV